MIDIVSGLKGFILNKEEISKIFYSKPKKFATLIMIIREMQFI